MTISPQNIRYLLDNYWGPLVAWVGPCSGAGEDVVQQAFIALARQSLEPSNPVAWLYRTSRNLAINEQKQSQRRKRRHQALARTEEQPSSVWQNSEAAELAERLAKLPDDLRQVVVARIWGGFSFEEIGEILSKSRATVWRHYNTAFDELRTLYGAPCQVKNKNDLIQN